MTTAPPGWYPDPSPPPGRAPLPRWWDGHQWTDHYSSPPSGKQPPTTPDGQPLAGFGERLLAYIIDAFIVGPIGLLLSLPLLIPMFDRMLEEIERSMDSSEPQETFQFWYFDSEMVLLTLGVGAIGLLVGMAYEVGFLRWKQATPGKLAMGLRVRLREAPGPLPWRVIWLRWLVKNVGGIASQVPIVGGFLALAWWINFLWPLWDEQNQALHDKAAATNVVKVR